MNGDRPNQNQEVVKAAALGVFFGAFLFALAYLTASEKGIAWPWWRGLFGLLVCAACALLLLVIALVGHRAYQFQALAALTLTAWTLPLLAAGFELTSWSPYQVAWVVVLCGVNAVVSFGSALRKLSAQQDRQAGRLDGAAGIWILDRPILEDPNKEAGKNLAKLLLPLASGLGAIVYRLSSESGAFFAGLMFFMAFLLISGPAMHAAAAVYLWRKERELGKRINI